MRRVEATFQREADAKAARESLLSDGVEAQRISILNRSRAQRIPPSGAEKGRGLWANIKDIVSPQDEPDLGPEPGLKQGGYVLTVSVANEKLEGVIALLAKTGEVEFDQADAESAPQRAVEQRAEVHIPVVEESLAVDVRSADEGGVRLSSHTVEEPVHDRVHLYDYRVSIERRAIDRAAGASGRGNLDELFRERVIEMVETTDEVRFLKEARVREEVVVRKEVTERVEFIDTTLRRTEVEVEKVPPKV